MTNKYSIQNRVEYKESTFQKLYRKLIWWKLKDFFKGLHNIIKWLPTIYHDRDWGYENIYDILEKKLLFVRNNIVKYNSFTKAGEVNRDITICLNIIHNLKLDKYNCEYQDYENNEDQYIGQNKNTHRKILTELQRDKKKYSIDIMDKKLRSRRISYNKHNKATKLLFNIMTNKIDTWWD